jgi:hypothetical protein
MNIITKLPENCYSGEELNKNFQKIATPVRSLTKPLSEKSAWACKWKRLVKRPESTKPVKMLKSTKARFTLS